MSDPNHKAYLKIFAGVTVAGAVGLVALNWLVDPLQFYRKAAYPPLLVGQKRFQAPGLAKNYDYDTVIIGTSMSENFQPQQVADKLGGKALNLSLQGASAREQSLMLQVALRSGKVRRVIWELNYEYLRGDPQWVSDYDGSFPFYFYDENVFNDLGHYLLSVDTAKQSLKVLLGRAGVRPYESRAPEDVFSWYRTKQFGVASVRRAWERAAKSRDSFRKQIPEYAAENLNANFDRNILPLLRDHADVKCHLFFPPFLAAYYANVRKVSPQILANLAANRRHVFEQTRGLPNVELFDFQTAEEIIFDLDDYCDLMHFNLRVNDTLLEAIRDGRHQMTAEGSRELEALTGSERLSTWVKQHVGP
jgi:hypothetical protein